MRLIKSDKLRPQTMHKDESHAEELIYAVKTFSSVSVCLSSRLQINALLCIIIFEYIFSLKHNKKWVTASSRAKISYFEYLGISEIDPKNLKPLKLDKVAMYSISL